MSVSSFLQAHAPGVQVSPVVALQNMIAWGNFKPDGLFTYEMGNNLSGLKMMSRCDDVVVACAPPVVVACAHSRGVEHFKYKLHSQDLNM